MTRQKLFFMAGIILMIMIAVFSIKVFSSPETACYPVVDWQCYQDMEDECAHIGADCTGDWLYWSFCSGTTCVGVYKFYCDFVVGGYIVCSDSDSGFGCEHW